MIAHVDLHAAAENIERQKDADPAARLPKGPQHPALQTMRPHGIVQQPHFHSLAGPSSQCFQEPEAGRVRPKDECFQVDVMLGGANRVQHGGERGMALVIEDEVVSGADGRRAKAAGQSANLFPTGGLHTRGRRPVLHLLRLTRDRLLRCRYPLLHESLSMPPLARQRPANVLIAEEQEEERFLNGGN